MKIFYPGDEHTPPNEKRAKQLIDLGFIKEIEKEEEAKKATEKEKGKVEKTEKEKAGQKSKQKKE